MNTNFTVEEKRRRTQIQIHQSQHTKSRWVAAVPFFPFFFLFFCIFPCVWLGSNAVHIFYDFQSDNRVLTPYTRGWQKYLESETGRGRCCVEESSPGMVHMHKGSMSKQTERRRRRLICFPFFLSDSSPQSEYIMIQKDHFSFHCTESSNANICFFPNIPPRRPPLCLCLRRPQCARTPDTLFDTFHY